MNRKYIKTRLIHPSLLALLLCLAQQAMANPQPPPTWTVDLDDYEFNMNAVIRLRYTSTPSNATGNIIGAFVGNELRGVATPTFIGGDAYYFMTIYSNNYTGETVRFKTYYSPDDLIYPSLESVVFIHNSTKGSAANPYWINIDPNLDFPPQWLPILADTTLVSIPFDVVNLQDFTISLDGDPLSWSAQPGPNLNAAIVNGMMTIAPASSIWVGTDSVRLIVTENTIGQLADTITAWFTVLPDYGAPMWQTIPDQTIFPGNMFAAFDLDDYLTFNGDCHGFDFDVFPFTGAEADPTWPPVPPGSQTMSVVARPLFADIPLAGIGAKLAGFVNGVLAGWAVQTGVFPSITYSLTLENVGVGNITFKFYDAARQYLYEEITSLPFVAGGSAGTMANPYPIQLSPLLPSLNASGMISIAVDDPSWQGSYPIDFIVWDCDFAVQRRDTTQAIFSITTDENPHITSPETVNFEENACSLLYDAQSSDPNDIEGAGLTYSLAGGADESWFAIDPVTGILNWVAGFSPDFETPQDADNNNQYQIKIRVVNTAMLADTLALTVSITNQATEPFAVKINNGETVICSTGPQNLLASGGVSYVWSTGETTASILTNNTGTYTVTATSTGACTATASMLIAAPPSITAMGNNAPVCLGANIQLSSTPAGGTLPYTSFAWSGPDSYSANVEDPAGFPALATSGGIYRVTVTDAAGCTATSSKNIMVTGTAAPTITASSNSPVCIGANIQLSSSPSGGSGVYTQFSWAGPNGYNANSQNPAGFTATLAKAGLYSVTVTDNAGCSGTGSTNVQVSSKPTISAGSNSPVCVGSSILLFSTPSGGSGTYTNFSWSGPNSFTATVQNPAGFPASNAAAGTYLVTLTDNAGCTGTGSTSVSVNNLPSITASLLAPVCTGGMVALASSPSGGSGTYTSFLWTGPGGYVSMEEDPVAFPVNMGVAGMYTVLVADASGCTASASVTVTINNSPTITSLNNGPVCQGANITLSSSPGGGSGTYPTFLWMGPDGYVASQEDPVPFITTLASAGVYQVKVTDGNGCTATATTTAVINPKPTITASSNAPLCTGAILNLKSTPVGGSGTYSTFNWTGPASYVAAGQNPPGFPVTDANAGTYRITLTDNAGCTATASTNVSVSTFNAPTITAGSNSPVCGGTNLSLTSTPTGGSGTYIGFGWAGPNNYSSTLEDPAPFQVFTNGAGTYTVTVTDNKNCKGTASIAVVVTGPASNPTSNSPVCPNGSIVLNGGSFLSGATYQWSGPNGYSSNLRLPPGFPAIPAAAGVYSLTITHGGCSGAGTTTVAIQDLIPPVIVCPANATVAANTFCMGVVGVRVPLSLSDNCNANPTVTQSPVAGTALNGYNDVRTVTLTANDGNANTASCTFTVTLKDVTAPTITCPANVTLAANAACAGSLGAYAPLSMSDNCNANPLSTQSPVSGTTLSGHNDFRTVTLSASDGNGNTGTCSFSVTLKDVTAPTIVCPANITIAANATCNGLLGMYAPVSVSDNCNANPMMSQSPASGTVLNGHNDVRTVTLTANDNNGNTGTCTFTATLKDVTAPAIICPLNVTIGADGNCTGVLGAYAPLALSDNCNASPTLTQNPVSGTVLNGHNDARLVTLTANDGNGNTNTCTFTATLKDIAKPVIVCPANATVAADGACSGVLGTYSPLSVSDNCNANPGVTQSPNPSTTLNGHNDSKTVTLMADDGNGNLEFCTFTVTLKDISPPNILCPANATVAANGTCSGPIGAFSPISVSDNCNAIPGVTQSPSPSTVLNGHNDSRTVTLTADDGNGNTATCTLTVTLKDVTKPTITCPANTTLAADADCSSLLGAYTAVSVSDNCSANPGVSQSPGASTILMGHNDTRTITLTANDGNGNTESCMFTVTLLDLTPPMVTCKPYTALLDGSGNVTVLPINIFNTGSDNCGTINLVSVLPNTFHCSNIGTVTVTLTANDAAGNTASCTVSVTVVDNIPPMVVCKVKVDAVLNAGGMVTIVPADAYESGSDNCGMVNLASVFPNNYSCLNIGPNVATLTINDGHGNTASCATNVVVADHSAPTMLCQNVTLNLNANGQATLTTAAVNNGSFDNCMITTLSLSQTQFTCANLGNSIVTLTGTDQSGNSSQCTATITVRDLIAPVARCKNAIVGLGANGSVTVAAATVDNISTDNCSLTLSLTPNVFFCSNIGANTVILKATDGSNNMATCTATVAIRDLLPPVALCKNAIIFLNNVGQATLSVGDVDNGSTDNCGINNRTLNRTDFNCSDLGAAVNVTFTVRDATGNNSTCNAAVTVKDNLPPSALCENVTVSLGSNGTVAVYPAVLAANSTDNCSVWAYSPVVRVYNSSNLGPNNLTITVSDFSGNHSTCVSVVTVMMNGPSERPGAVDTLGNTENADMQLRMYPNPSAGDVLVSFELRSSTPYKLSIFGLKGHVAHRMEAMGVAGENIVLLRRELFAPGIYFLQVQAKEVSSYKRLIVRE